MAGRVTTYDPARTFVSFGYVILGGYADGEAITIERDSDEESAVAGVDGDVVRVRNASRLARVTIRLQGGALANQLLRSLRALANPLIPSADQGAFILRDLSTGVEVSSPTAWISKEPLPGLAADAPVHEWEITCSYLTTKQIVALP